MFVIITLCCGFPINGTALGFIDGADEGVNVQKTVVELSLNVYACEALSLP